MSWFDPAGLLAVPKLIFNLVDYLFPEQVETFTSNISNLISENFHPLKFISSTISEALYNLILFLPDNDGFPQIVYTASETFGSYVSAVNAILPMDTVISVSLTIITIYAIAYSFYWIKSLFMFIRGTESYNKFTTKSPDATYTFRR